MTLRSYKTRIRSLMLVRKTLSLQTVDRELAASAFTHTAWKPAFINNKGKRGDSWSSQIFLFSATKPRRASWVSRTLKLNVHIIFIYTTLTRCHCCADALSYIHDRLVSRFRHFQSPVVMCQVGLERWGLFKVAQKVLFSFRFLPFKWVNLIHW